MDADVLVVGAGAIGLACGAALASAGRSVLVAERHDGPGRETSSRSSEVIHAGLYYPPDSLKTRLCVAGRKLLYARCERRGIPHRKTGKLIVAAREEELPTLEEIWARGLSVGAGELALIDRDWLRQREPRVSARGALWSPESGIVDTHALLSSYQAELEAAGGNVVFRTAVEAVESRREGFRIRTISADGERYAIEVRSLINAAGLEADRIAELAGIDVDAEGLRQHPCKGDYFAVSPALGALTRHLVYPVPVPGGLGIHVTLDLGGRYRLGPDVEWIDAPDYKVEAHKAELFAEAAARYLPELRAEHLTPDFAGVRPKLQAKGEGFRDFYLAEASELGAPGLVNLLGIESPGITASEAIAHEVAELLDR